MFEKIFLSAQVKQSVIMSNKLVSASYQTRNIRKISKLHRIID